ncbi:MAG: tRNA-5-carboxymethylaminomethyl-2-thiouridine(34) synthesis protein MnmE [Pseudolabrys sp.]|jgi:tRNA modification GTPase|nr:tRNA-5-carboxymethylaminomethyl-2-thiouridine(34) synthesis protein MnmE [Pseudolabrys sp.]
MTPPPRDTIFALSSGHGIAALAVIRISGERAGEALEILTGKIPTPRKAALVTIRAADREPIDQALALYFPGPNSETGEDVAELQVHGGRAVVAAVLARLGGIKGLRPAEAGEFTRRAFENGKIDLTQVEGLADLVFAETEAQRRQAFRQMTGLLGGRADAWRGRLLGALAMVEARIDFSDEADVPEDLLGPALRVARDIEADIAAALAQGRRGERLREGLVVAIAGPPNAGKSTLLNRIARREAAIVSPHAGTTRDIIEVHLDLDGYPVTVVDTAGIRPTADPVEQEGVRRARERASAADLVLWVVDASAGEAADRLAGLAPDTDGPLADPVSGTMPGQDIWLIENKVDLIKERNEQRFVSLTSQVKDQLTINRNQSLTSDSPHRNEHMFELYSKTLLTKFVNNPLGSQDHGSSEPLFKASEQWFGSFSRAYAVSATAGTGLGALVTALAAKAVDALGAAEPALLTRERHRAALEATRAALQRAIAVGAEGREDVLAEELRLAATALSRLTGRIDVEDILDVIFRDFCIGK